MTVKKKIRKKTGGRKAGTPNKVTTMSKEVIASLLTNYSESGLMIKDFALLEAKDRMTIAERLMQYVIPKMSSIDADVTSKSESEKNIEDKLKELSEISEQ